MWEAVFSPYFSYFIYYYSQLNAWEQRYFQLNDGLVQWGLLVLFCSFSLSRSEETLADTKKRCPKDRNALCLIIHSGYIDKTEKNSQVLSPSTERSLLRFPSHFPVVAHPQQWLMQGPPACSRQGHWVPEAAQLPGQGSFLVHLLCSRASCSCHPSWFGNLLVALHSLLVFTPGTSFCSPS